MGARRFVHVFATFGAGGPQVRAVQLLAHLGPGCEHVVMAMDGNTAAAARLPASLAVRFAERPARAGWLATVRRQRDWLEEQRPDLVLTYNWGAIETAAAARRLGLPRVHHEDGFGPEEVQRRLRRRSWVRRLVLREVPVIVPSLVLQRIAVQEWRLAPDLVQHLPNGVDLQRFRPVARGAAPALVGTVGGLRAEKDHTTLLAAFAELGGEPRLCLVGGGPMQAALQADARARGLGDRVQFVGPVDDAVPHYTRFTVFVLPSRTEQMPIAMLEAMACGLPVVATDVGDVRAILPAEAAPCIVPAGDAHALAAALRRVLADAALAARLGAANRERVEQRYEAKSCLDRFVRVYDNAARR
ncbi:MAG TPA: glycosyltransferase family 4 protein [Planctomycetota bacterium]|nr:glycosyltransferase family 4 protein [Planctomycetota bacterium]